MIMFANGYTTSTPTLTALMGLFLEKKFVKLRSVHFEELIFEHISMSVENKTIAKFHELKRFPY